MPGFPFYPLAVEVLVITKPVKLKFVEGKIKLYVCSSAVRRGSTLGRTEKQELSRRLCHEG